MVYIKNNNYVPNYVCIVVSEMQNKRAVSTQCFNRVQIVRHTQARLVNCNTRLHVQAQFNSVMGFQ